MILTFELAFEGDPHLSQEFDFKRAHISNEVFGFKGGKN
jgi:hypothetical protein